MKEFIKFLTKVSNLSNQAKQDLAKCMEQETFDKNEKILEAGNTCNHLYFLRKGLVRIYYLKEGKEITEHFVTEQNIFGSIDSLVNRRKSILTIEALEPCQLYSISHSHMETLYSQHHDLERVGRLLSIQAFLQIQTRLYALQFHNATERYENLVKEYPDLVHRVPLGQIASYLGITQVSLSRIRSKQSVV